MGPKTGVAIPSHVAAVLLDGPTLGVSGRLVGLASPWQERFGAATGILVDAVAPGSLADRAGMRRGDVLVAVDGEAATGVVDLARLLARRAGRVVELTVLRESGLRSLEVLVPV
jgi:S1-C subfamily serine protease